MGLQDWADHNTAYNGTNTLTKYPDSYKNKLTGTTSVDGCLIKIDRYLKDNMWVIGGIIFAIVLYLMISVLLVSIAIMSINQYKRQLYTQEQQTLLQQELQAMPYRATTVPQKC